jgi:hypothetical protein
MASSLVLIGLGVAALPALLRRLGRRLAPSEWAQLTFIALVGAGVLVEAGLILVAAPTVLRSIGMGVLADACDRLVGPLTPLGDGVGWVAAALAVASPVLGAVGWVRARRRLGTLAIEPYLGRHESYDDHEVVVLPTEAHIAYSVDLGVPQVVLSQGLVDALDEDQLEVLVAHELAHLRHDHPRMLLVAAAVRSALAWWPMVRHSHRAFRASIERWADECAAGGQESTRRSLSEALHKVAAVARPAPIATFSLADATAERIEAMRSRPEAPWTVRAALYLPGAAAGAFTLGSIGLWLSDVQAVLAMAGRCPI